MARKKWIIKSADKEYAKQLAEECNIDPLVALILLARNCYDPVEIDEFLSDELCFSNPFDLPDMDKAVQRIRKAIKEDERIAVCGDYDADGVTASALLYTYLREKNCNVICYIPERLEQGYGLHRTTIDYLHENNISLIITVDNGISAAEEIKYAKDLKIDTVVTDHHLPGAVFPAAEAVVDPHLPDCACYYKDYAGVGVAFMLICALEEQPCEVMLEKYGDLVALGTIADMVPLKSENRMLVKKGMEVLNRRGRIGMDELLKTTSYAEKTIDAGGIAFGIAPRINAAGRMGKSIRAFKLLTADDREEASKIAAEIREENALRQSTEGEITKVALASILKNKAYLERVIVVSGENWHNGILGIVAARICERFGKPTVVISSDGKMAKGSARSVDGFDLFAALSACSDLLTQVGGHKLAAGLTIETEKIDVFSKRINEYALKASSAPVPLLAIDCCLNPLGATLSTFDAIQCLAPFGCDNSEPVFGLMGMTVHAIHAVGASGNTLKLTLRRDDTLLVCLKFSTSIKDFPYQNGDMIDVAVTLKENIYRGNRSLSVIIKDIRPSQIDEEVFFFERAIYEKFAKNEPLSEEERKLLIPSREDMATVFRYLKGHSGFRFSTEILYMRLDFKINYAKMLVCLDIMEEFLFISKQFDSVNTLIQFSKSIVKRNFDSSAIIKRLKGRE